MKTKETCYLSGGLVVDEFGVALLGHKIIGRLHFQSVHGLVCSSFRNFQL